MNDLQQLVESGEITTTGAKPKLPTTIPNLTDTMLNVYRIPLKYLYYNDENGRIATQLKRDSEILQVSDDEVNSDYNDKIAQFIAEDNATALKKTKKSIKEKGQQVYGYVLLDGRIIDGNRRYTALRQLESESGETQYFEAVILPFTYDAKADRAQIKRLELAIQMGTEEKVQYDPVDLSVDIYQTIIKDDLMSVKDYSKESSMSVKDINDRIATVELIQDFLKFINASTDDYFIIKDVKLYNPLYEFAKKFAKKYPAKGPSYEQTKSTAFTLLGKMVVTGGDMVRETRQYMKNVVDSPVNDEYNDAVEDTVDDFREKLDAEPIHSAADYRLRLEKSVPELSKTNEIYAQTVNRENRSKNVDSFIAGISEAVNTLEEMKRGDGVIGSINFNDLGKDQINEIRNMLVKVNITSQDLIEVYDRES